MDPLIGAAIAAGVGWGSIALVALLPGRDLVPPAALRTVGALTIGLMAVAVVGLPLSTGVILGFLIGGLVGAWSGARHAPATRHEVA
ncbi:MAG: hypothetical protein ACPGQL_06765 [Thermoplasmatota archaeon]